MFENIVRETEIERIVRERTPDFFCGTNYYIGKFHSTKWQGVVHFKNGKKVIKTATVNNEIVRKEYDVAMPDFVLMNKNQMEHLRNSYEKAERGLNYSNPFSRKTGWYCEVFGDYWHGEEITTVPKEEHERQVIEAYESGGNHVLILWEKDILYHWKEYCEPKIKAYINDFLKENEVEENVEFYQGKCLSDLSLKCLNDANVYRLLTQEEKETVLDNMVDVYKDVDLSCDKFEAKMDLMNYNKRIQNGFKVGLRGVINYDGNDLLNAFIKTRFDARPKNRRSLNELVKDEKLMRKCIDYQLSNETGTHHFKRFLSAMIFADGQRFVTNLNQSLIYNRLVEYSKEGGIFYDPCAGWGGRLLAAYAMKMKYIAIDANKKLVEELKQLAEFMNYKDCEIYYGDSSDCKFVEKIMNGRKIDLAFTCPPYFDEEIYSDDEFQSIKMYPNKEDWYKYFLDYMKKGVFEHLKEDGVFVLCIDEKLDLKNLTNVCINEFNATKSSDKEDKFYFVKNATETFVENVDFVRCELCGKGFQRLGSHLLKFHNMEIEDYLNQFPDAEIVCEKESQSVAERNRNKFDQPVKYKKRFVYLLPDGTYASKSDVYKREWNTQEVKDAHIIDASTIDYVPRYAEGIVNGEEGKDYVVCKICGYKAKSLTQHIRKEHDLTKEEYQEKYQGEVYSDTAKEAFHQCALNKWKTQFETGQSQRAIPKERVENPSNKERNDITYEILEKLQNEGKTQVQLQKILGCSEPTLYKWMQVVGYKPMSKTLNAIKRVVFEGAELNLEEMTQDKLDELYQKFNKDELMKKCGVRRTVFETWLKTNNLVLRKVKK